MSELTVPKEWAKCNISDVISANGMFCDGDWVESKDQDPNGEVRLIQLADIGGGYFKNKSERFLTKEKAGALNCTFLNKGDLLIARLPDPLGRACLFPLREPNRYVTVVDVCIVRPNTEKSNSYFLLHLVNSPGIRAEIEKYKSGTTRKRISRKNLAKVLLPIAPLPEQNQIVSIIEQLFSDLDNAIDNLKKAKDQLKIYRQSVLKYAFEGKLTEEWRAKHQEVKSGKETLSKIINKVKQPALNLENCADIPQEWLFTSIVNLVASKENSLKRGPFGSAIKKAFFVSSGYKVYEQQNAIKKDCSLGTYYINQDKFDELKHFAVHPGDFIVSCAGTIGCITEVPEGSEEGVINQALLKVKFNEDLMVKKFFVHQFESYVRRYMHATSKGSAMKNMSSVKDLKQIPFIYTSIEEQKEIVQEIESRFSVCDKMEEAIANSLEQADALRQSILKQAFEGKLTEEWRKNHLDLISGENSAEALLEKIESEKEALQVKMKKKQKDSQRC